VPYLSALEICSRQGVIQIHVYLYLYLYLTTYTALKSACKCSYFEPWSFVVDVEYLDGHQRSGSERRRRSSVSSRHVKPINRLDLPVHRRRGADDPASWIDGKRTGIELGRPISRVVQQTVDQSTVVSVVRVDCFHLTATSAPRLTAVNQRVSKLCFDEVRPNYFSTVCSVFHSYHVCRIYCVSMLWDYDKCTGAKLEM